MDLYTTTKDMEQNSQEEFKVLAASFNLTTVSKAQPFWFIEPHIMAERLFSCVLNFCWFI